MIYIDRRVYVMTLKEGLEYNSDMVARQPHIRNFKSVCREMVEEFDLGDYTSCEMDIIEFFAETKCGCDHEISPGDAIMMPEGTIFFVVDKDDAMAFGTVEYTDCPWDDSLCIIEYRCSDVSTTRWVSGSYPRNARKKA